MAKKVVKTTVKADHKAEAKFNQRIAKLCGQGELRLAAETVAAANLSEARFDAIMASDARLREAFSRL